MYTVVISNRLVISSCAIVADESGYTANLEKLISKCCRSMMRSMLTANINISVRLFAHPTKSQGHV